MAVTFRCLMFLNDVCACVLCAALCRGRSRRDVIFGQYLDAVHQELPLMHFCQSVLRYQQVGVQSVNYFCQSHFIF